MKFTVLGASGYIGRHLVPHLRAQGAEVWAPAKGDLTGLDQPLGHVIYAVGLTAGFRTRPYDTVQAHVGWLAQLLQRCQFDSWLYLSSTRVYNGAPSGHEDSPLKVSPGQPDDLYNLSKLLGESLVLQHPHPAARVVRLSNVLGPGQQHSPNFVPSLIRAAWQGQVVLKSPPTTTKDYIALADVLQALPRISQHGTQRLYNLASGRALAHAEILSLLQQHTGCQVQVAPQGEAVAFPALATERIAQLGLVPIDPTPVVTAMIDELRPSP